MEQTTVKMDKSVRDRLKEWKGSQGLDSLSDAVAELLNRVTGKGGNGGSDGEAAPMDVGSDGEKKEERIPQLFFYDVLPREEKALKYHTGLRPGAQKWLMTELRQADDKALQKCEGNRRLSDFGYRKLSQDDRILLFLIRMRRREPFESLRINFGVAFGTSHNYYTEMLKTFNEYIVPRLLRPLSAEEIDRVTPADFKEDLPGAMFIVDLTAFRSKSKENVLLSRILYSAYHHQSESASVFVIAPNGLFVYRNQRHGGLSSEVLTQFNKSGFMGTLKAHGVIPEEGLAPDVKILVADSAYHRVSAEWKGHVYLPSKQPADGSNLENDALKKSHKVQSHRGLVERMFARLKKWNVLSGGSIESIETMEMELDAAMALQNLNELDRLGLMDMIPQREHFAAGSHIISNNLEPNLKIPKKLSLADAKFPDHLRQFHQALTTLAPKLRKLVQGVPQNIIFTGRVAQRGQNLFLGGNVLQVRAEAEALDVWRVCFSVGASMKAPVYICYARLRADDGVLASICECRNGEAKCAHLCAGLRALVQWNEVPKEVTLVGILLFQSDLLGSDTRAFQCVRDSPLQKPDIVLRQFSLQKVFEASKRVHKTLLFHSMPFRFERDRQSCFCGCKSNNKMVLCDGCHEWFHLDCVGITGDAAEEDDAWRCGYCLAAPDGAGNRIWTLNIPQGKRKRKKVAGPRNDAKTPKALGIDPFVNKEIVGPSEWADFVALAKEGGRKINEKEAKLKRRAQVLVKEGGHHVVDEVSLGRVVARPVDATLVDDLVGQGLLRDDDDDEPADEEEAEDE